MNDILQVGSARAAAAFEHPQSRRLVLGLVAKEQSLQELAGATGLSLSLLHYYLGRLRRLGLVEIASVERRPGRPVKRYRAVARKFVVPAALATGGAGKALARELRNGLERDRARGDDEGIAYFVDPAGVQRMNRMRGPSSRLRAFEVWSALSLAPQEAEKLAADLRALLARYGRRSGGGAHPFIAYCAFARRKQAPMPEHRRDR